MSDMDPTEQEAVSLLMRLEELISRFSDQDETKQSMYHDIMSLRVSFFLLANHQPEFDVKQ